MSTGIPASESVPLNPSQVDVAEIYLKERGKPVPGAAHAFCQTRLGCQLMRFDGYVVLGELNLDLCDTRIVPDLCVFDRQQESLLRNQIWVAEPPRMAVEIFSPFQTVEEMTARIDQLLTGGVPSVWLVIPFAKVITVFQKGVPLFSATSGILTDPVTGISVNVDEIFA